MRKIILLVLLSFICNAQSTIPNLLSNYEFSEKIISTEDGEEFIAWIVEDDEARELNKAVRKLNFLEKDNRSKTLTFRTYNDGNYEYVVAKNKWNLRRVPFFRITVYTIDELISSEEMSKKTKSKFDGLKKKLVITTGDNYVGAAKKQLREKMADLYSKVASSYDIPSENELDNLKLIEKEMVSAKNSYNKLLKKVDLSKLNLKTYDEFVNE